LTGILPLLLLAESGGEFLPEFEHRRRGFSPFLRLRLPQFYKLRFRRGALLPGEVHPPDVFFEFGFESADRIERANVNDGGAPFG